MRPIESLKYRIAFGLVSLYTRFQKKCALFNVVMFRKLADIFICKFGMVSPKYTIHRSNITNIKPIPCWAEIFAIYGNTEYSLICTCSPRKCV